MAKSIKILHLSDIHFSTPTLDSCLTKLLEYVKKNKIKFRGKIDFVVVSGDVAQKGLSKEFDSCRSLFFDELNKYLNLKDFSNYLFVCGNHDILRDKLQEDLKPFVKDYLDDVDTLSDSERKDILSDRKKYSEYYTNRYVKSDLRAIFSQACNLEDTRVESRARKLLDKYFKTSLEPYIKFVRNLKGYRPYKNVITEKNPDHWSKWLFGRRQETLTGDVKVNLFGFNSSWFCVGNDNGNLFLLHELAGFPKKGKRFKDITISVLHHPPSWLQWSERNSESGVPAFGKILDLSDMILVGHEHDRHVQAPTYYGSQTLLVSSGSTLEKDTRHPNNIKILQLHLKEDEPNQVNYLSYDSLTYQPNASVHDEKKWVFAEGYKGFPFEMPTVEVEYSERDFWAGEAILLDDELIKDEDRRKFVVENYIKGFGKNIHDIQVLSSEGIYEEKSGATPKRKTIFMPFDFVEFLKPQEVSRFDVLYDIGKNHEAFVILLPYSVIKRDSKIDEIVKDNLGDVIMKFRARDDIHVAKPLLITNSEVYENSLMSIPQKMVDSKPEQHYFQTSLS